ncbi:hypothetical protein PCIT_a1017 [Pseudoalteromonas citrea]|uniref:Outer membrane protein beta-barrel domain-containing protein n=2 Tax=Pseudoalteromonas citrea TaxID=43655 RepID=A0AAD4ALI9_9GAMM|nr:hypothetical protein [Pseudoalteromonas citrea]KAF7774553.1 hypothetical protein PCIT_a1017 [Pseudoalteromonas citrea]
MLNKISFLVALFCVGASQANELSDRNLVTRSLTVQDSELQFIGALGYGKNGDEDGIDIGLDARYGLSDDWTLGLGHTRYRFLERGNSDLGLELTVGAGLKGMYEKLGRGNVDVLGYGADIMGKYVYSQDTALVFGAQYVFWNVQHTDKNADEYRFNLGVQHQVFEDVVISADYTLRSLNDMTQSTAHEASVSMNYAISKNLDTGVFVNYSSFDPVKNGFTADSANKQGIGGYISYRF